MIQQLAERSVQMQLDTVTDLEKKEELVREPIEGKFVEQNICLLPEVGDTVSTRMCGICKKNFLNRDYVSKHIINKHHDLIQIKQNKTVLLEVIRTEFLKDPECQDSKYHSKEGQFVRDE